MAQSSYFCPKVLFLDEPTNVVRMLSVQGQHSPGHYSRLIQEEEQLFSWPHDLVILSSSVIGFLWLIGAEDFWWFGVAQEDLWQDEDSLLWADARSNHLLSRAGLPDMSIDRLGSTLNIEFDSSASVGRIIKQASDFWSRNLKRRPKPQIMKQLIHRFPSEKKLYRD